MSDKKYYVKFKGVFRVVKGVDGNEDIVLEDVWLGDNEIATGETKHAFTEFELIKNMRGVELTDPSIELVSVEED